MFFLCSDSSGHTLIIRDSATGEEVATIIQSEEGEVSYDPGVEEGQMTIHIAEDVMQDQGAMGQVGWSEDSVVILIQSMKQYSI